MPPVAPFWKEAARSPSNTTLPGSRPTLIHQAVWPQRTWTENWGGGCPLVAAGELGRHLILSPWPRPTSIPNGILIHAAVWPQYMSQNWGSAGGCGSPSNTMSPGRGLSPCLAIMDMCPFWEGKLGPDLTQCGRGGSLPPCQVLSLSIQPFGHNMPTSQTGETDRTDNGPIA